MATFPVVTVTKPVVYDRYTGQLAVPMGTQGIIVGNADEGRIAVQFPEESAALWNGTAKIWHFEPHELQLNGTMDIDTGD